jgi:hypothetical protein
MMGGPWLGWLLAVGVAGALAVIAYAGLRLAEVF